MALCDQWRSEILKGVTTVSFPDCVPGSIIVYGEKSEAIIVNESGQVLCAAAEHGKGRIIVFSHDMFVNCFNSTESSERNKDLITNIRQWITRGKGQNGEIKSLERVLQEIGGVKPNGSILTWNGLTFPSAKQLDQLLKWISEGGGLICGVCPWGFVSIFNIQVKDMPLNHVFDQIEVSYAGEETLENENYEIKVNEIRPGFVKPAEIIRGVQQDHSLCSKLCHLVEHLPENVYDRFKDDIHGILQTLEQSCNCIPTKDNPIDSNHGKTIAILKCNVMIREGQNGHPVNCEGHFPGTFCESTPCQSATLSFTSNIQKFHPTGFYLPPGKVMDVSWKKSKKPWNLLIGLHVGKLNSVKGELRRWPTVSMRLKLESSPAKICSPFGGLIYLESPIDTQDTLIISIDNVVEAPMFTYDKSEEWGTMGRFKPGLWCDVIGDKISFTLPSDSVREIPDLTTVMHFWDCVVAAHIELRGKDSSNGRGQWVVTDEQLFDGAYMHSGYPIATHLDVADHKKESGDSFIFDENKIKNEGAWGIFHEIGHNFQDDLWTWDGTVEVTVNIFTLHAMEVICKIDPWFHPWLRNNFEKAKAYLQNGANYTEWCNDPGVALMVYAQLARDFGWDVYKTVFTLYDNMTDDVKPKTNDQKKDVWILTFSNVVNRNLCPLFEFWGWPISNDVITKMKAFPTFLPEDESTIEFAPQRANEIRMTYTLLI